MPDPFSPDELADALDAQSPELLVEAEVQVEAAAALRRLGALERVLGRIPAGAQLHLTPPQSWHPAGDPLWRAWIAGTGKWGEGSDGMTALVMLADALEVGDG